MPEEQQQQETPEEIDEEESPEPKMLGDFLSPIGVIMLFAAGIIDLTGFIIMCFGLDDFGIVDTIGLIFVGGLMWVHSGTITSGKKDRKITKKTTTKKFGGKILKRLGLSFLIEIIPYIGGLVPSWTIAAYFDLKNS